MFNKKDKQRIEILERANEEKLDTIETLRKEMTKMHTKVHALERDLELARRCTNSVRDALIKKQEIEMDNLKDEHKSEIAKLKQELEYVLPIVKNVDLKPAISEECINCKFAVIDYFHYPPRILGCRKDQLCNDYHPNER